MSFRGVYDEYVNAGRQDNEIYLAIRRTVTDKISPVLEAIVEDFREQLGVS